MNPLELYRRVKVTWLVFAPHSNRIWLNAIHYHISNAYILKKKNKG